MNATLAPPTPVTAAPAAARLRWLDLALASAATVIAAFAVMLPNGATRAALTLPVIVFVPGYLLLQAVLGKGEPPSPLHVIVAVGISPPLVGLLALLTAIVPGGFTAGPIIAVVTTACLALAAVALVRRGMRKAAPTE